MFRKCCNGSEVLSVVLAATDLLTLASSCFFFKLSSTGDIECNDLLDSEAGAVVLPILT